MAESFYVILTPLTPGTDPEAAAQHLASALGVDTQVAAIILRKAPIFLFRELDEQETEHVAPFLNSLAVHGLNVAFTTEPPANTPKVNWPARPDVRLMFQRQPEPEPTEAPPVAPESDPIPAPEPEPTPSAEAPIESAMSAPAGIQLQPPTIPTMPPVPQPSPPMPADAPDDGYDPEPSTGLIEDDPSQPVETAEPAEQTEATPEPDPSADAAPAPVALASRKPLVLTITCPCCEAVLQAIQLDEDEAPEIDILEPPTINPLAEADEELPVEDLPVEALPIEEPPIETASAEQPPADAPAEEPLPDMAGLDLDDAEPLAEEPEPEAAPAPEPVVTSAAQTPTQEDEAYDSLLAAWDDSADSALADEPTEEATAEDSALTTPAEEPINDSSLDEEHTEEITVTTEELPPWTGRARDYVDPDMTRRLMREQMQQQPDEEPETAAPDEAPAEDDLEGSYTVYLNQIAAERRPQAVELITQVTGMPEAEATELAGRMVIPVIKDVSESVAKDALAIFEDAGFSGRIRENA